MVPVRLWGYRWIPFGRRYNEMVSPRVPCNCAYTYIKPGNQFLQFVVLKALQFMQGQRYRLTPR